MEVDFEMYPNMALLIKTARDNYWCICFISFIRGVGNVKAIFINECDCSTGYSINILHMGKKSLMQRASFKDSAGNFLPAVRFPTKLNNFCIFVIFFNVIYNDI